MQTGMGLAHLDAFALAALHHVAPESPLATQLSASTIRNFERTQQPQTAHRIEIIKSWNIELDGARVLEIGCGQGDASVVLASAVGDGCVTAWDPASPDYGSPLTVGQAQANLTSKPELKSLTFRLDSPLASLLHVDYDIAVLLHCIYYFPSPDVLSATLKDLFSCATTLCIAEYSLQASMPSQQPHVLAVLAQQALESLKSLGECQSNIQTVLSPLAIIALAKSAGWHLTREKFITPTEFLQDGRWEVGTVCSQGWMDEAKHVLGKGGQDTSRSTAWLAAARDATIAAVDKLADGGSDTGRPMDKVRTMDVWCGVFERGSTPA